jgi:hypothetical protein
MPVKFKIFRASAFTPWESLCDEVTEFASRFSREQIISISQSEDDNEGVVTVWYWSEKSTSGDAEN